jgi:hypothetical protein
VKEIAIGARDLDGARVKVEELAAALQRRGHAPGSAAFVENWSLDYPCSPKCWRPHLRRQ